VWVARGGSISGSFVRLDALSLVLSGGSAIHADGMGYFSGSPGVPLQAGCGPGGGEGDDVGGGGGGHGGVGWPGLTGDTLQRYADTIFPWKTFFVPTGQPTSQPSIPTSQPSAQPTRQPSRQVSLFFSTFSRISLLFVHNSSFTHHHPPLHTPLTTPATLL
jgi:hypothetical protein